MALAKFMVTPATLMVLDEPTNHLDIQSKEMLEEAVKHFEGTVIAVSHDRYFLREIATVRECLCRSVCVADMAFLYPLFRGPL